MILGIDEVGRGPWAGPLVVGAVVLPDDVAIEGLTDSKKLTHKRRVLLDAEIKQQALGYGLGWVHADELDEIGLSAALRLATVRAVQAVKASYHEIIIDGTINFLADTSKGKYVSVLPKADLLIPAVSAASIIAKVARDEFMAQQDAQYPQYGFGSHVGYGTAKHRQALLEHGVTPLHRRSFAPIKKLLGNQEAQVAAKVVPTAGQKAETLVAEHLAASGYSVVDRNWKNRYTEIDVIATKGTNIYFVEVKYRSSDKQGGGIAAITKDKQARMTRGAEMYLASHVQYQHLQPLLAVADITKDNHITLLTIDE